MPTTLLTGPINSGKTSRVLELLSQCDPGRTGTIVVPDRATAAELRRRFSRNLRGPLKALRADAIQDWPDLMRSLASPLLPVATRQHSVLVVMGLLAKIDLPHFGASARSYATATGFVRTILALKENLIGPGELEGIISGTGEPCLRERDLIRVYEGYDKELSRLGMLDEGDLAILAIKNAIEGAASLREMRAIMFDEFAMPTPALLAMVRALDAGLKKAEIVVTCPAAASEEERPFASWLARARDVWLAAICDEQRLDAANAGAPRISVLKAASPMQEARHVANILAKEGLAAGDCIVAVRHGDSFLEWFLSEAHSMGILPEHPTLDGAMGSPLAHELLSPDFVERLPSHATLAKFATEMQKIARVGERVKPWISGLKQRRGQGRVAARSLTAAESVGDSLGALSAAAGFLGETRISREQFVQLLSQDLSGRTAPATMIDSVLPFRLHAAGLPLSCEASRVIVPRMIEGSFPARMGESLFFADWKEESIRRIFPDAEDMHARESYAFETMLKKCIGEATLIMPAVTDEGKETIPSPFADRFLGPGEAPGVLSPCVLGRKREGLAKKRAEEPHAGVLNSPEARKIVRERFVEAELNPTALERYANCPFAFFAQDVLRAVEPLEDTPQIRGFDRGRIVHEILARFYREHAKAALAARSAGRIDEETRRTVRAIADEIWEERKDALEYVKPGLKGREIEEIANMALMVIRAEGDEASRISSPLIPREFEWEFSKKKGNALKINVKGEEPLYVRGRVDRIDADRDKSRFLVIDYKTGKEEQVVNRIESGSHLQLPLYISAVKSALFPEAVAMGGLMFEIREAAISGDGKKTAGKTKGLVLGEFEGACYRVGRAHSKIDAERMDELISAAEVKSAEFASSIRKGTFPPSNEAKCEWCDYGDICRHKKVSAD